MLMGILFWLNIQHIPCIIFLFTLSKSFYPVTAVLILDCRHRVGADRGGSGPSRDQDVAV